MFILRRSLIHRFPRIVKASRYFSELQSNTGSRRTVLVRNLPHGYDISNVLGTIKANPVEAIIPGDDQLTVRFLSEPLARKCVNRGGGGASLGWSLTLDEETSPKLSAYVVAAIGYSRLSHWITLKNLPRDLREEDLKHIIPRQVEYSPLRVRQQIFSHSYFEGVGLSFDQRDGDEYLFPDWYPQEDVNQRNVERALRISNVTSFDMDRTVRSWVREFEDSGAHHTLFYSLYPKKNLIKIVFTTSLSAREFIKRYMSAAEGINCLLRPQRGPLSLSKITAADLGASLALVIRLHRNQRRSLPEYHEAFNYSGDLKISEEFREDLSHGWVFLTFNSVNNVMRCMVRFERDEKHIGFEGAEMNFIGARDLAPFVKRYKRRGL
ncbi:hypothetical protein EDD18DRAFT_1355295 [Armillaria luteobubalina]|uniref:Uncharacterized protein n=1 Tax=Armillaria luteobubalina TaxID=153913 RepID=A0AA39Q1S5_9AGAR|nr:hypothetical protein EDD18DRAFT_1355295 [Armillaria luteobubalina]